MLLHKRQKINRVTISVTMIVLLILNLFGVYEYNDLLIIPSYATWYFYYTRVHDIHSEVFPDSNLWLILVVVGILSILTGASTKLLPVGDGGDIYFYSELIFDILLLFIVNLSTYISKIELKDFLKQIENEELK